jgi:cell surface protein SprA
LTLPLPKNLIANKLGRLIIAGLWVLAFPEEIFAQQDTTRTKQDTTIVGPYKPSKRPTFRPNDRYGDPFSNTTTNSPLFLKDPNKLKLDVEIDTAMNYTIYEKIGDINYRPTSTMSFHEFKQYLEREQLKSYWQSKSRAQDGESAVSGRGFVPKIFISPVLDRIFGGSYVELIPRGFVTLDFGGSWQKVNNPNIPIRQQRNGGFEFDQQINMSVVGKIGEKLAVTANFDNNNSFDFQNNMKVEYTGFKEDILKKLEIGNVSLPLNNTLIQGAQNLFGIKGQLQFGKMMVTAIASTQRGKVSSIDIGGSGPGGSGQGRPFEIVASQYDDNRHFFLGHFFRDNYQKWIANLPQIISGVNITRVEVYVLNRQSDMQTLRNVVGLMDLGEGRRVYNPNVGARIPGPNFNGANNLFGTVSAFNRSDSIDIKLRAMGFEGGTDYEKITSARKLSPTEYTFHRQLGYITLSRKLQNDEAIAVAYEYTYNGKPYKVGELSEDYASLKDHEMIFLKLLRPRKVSIRDKQQRIIPTWDLMMKNIYNLNVTQLSRDGFQLRIIYRDDRTGIDNPQLQEGSTNVRNRQLIEIFGLDKLNPVNDPQRDGNFDYVEGITINSSTGAIIFPYLEPFSEALRKAFAGEDNLKDYLIQKYSYDTLYRTTKADAELFATKNKFFLVGTYNAGSSKEILIPGFGVSQGSVKVFAGGIPLIEGQQYTVDYTFGKVTILDESILSSGKEISIQYEQSDPFAFQTRSLLGTRFDYTLSPDVNLGGTFLYYNERPLVSRNVIGSEPARNIQYGVDFNIRKDSRVLTKIIDALPLIQTKETSNINITGEFAQLLPGTSNIVNGEGIAYVDDFENTATPYSLMSPAAWKLAATPLTSNDLFGSRDINDLSINDKRAHIAWYQVDNQFYRSNSGRFKPDNITEADLRNHYVRAVGPKEIFPFRQLTQGVFFEQIFDVAYYPQERGMYNYDIQAGGGNLVTNDKSRFNAASDAKARWGGITTAIRTEVDFDKANIEYVEFWLLDPFIQGTNGRVLDGVRDQANTTGGKLIFHLGSVSEDVARDTKQAFENGLPRGGVPNPSDAEPNPFGYVTTQTYLTNAFDNDGSVRTNQDVGFDGMNNQAEKGAVPNQIPAYLKNDTDPSGDDFKYFLSGEFDANDAKLLERYKRINGLDGNTPIITGSDDITPSGSPYPDNEDLNQDNTLNETEEYYSYEIDLKPGQLDIGKGFIVDKIVASPENVPGEQVTWYLYRIPVKQFKESFGNISGFKSIRYARMILTGYDQPVVLRFANFRMVGSRWRKYLDDLRDGGLPQDTDPKDNFTLSVVNLEENGQGDANKSPYRIPPGVVRDRDNTSAISRQLNEQSVQICIEDLDDGDSRAIYKNVDVDFFNYGRIKMYFHATSEAADGELRGFIRLGTDFDQNYYEIEVPLKMTRPVNTDDLSLLWPEENEIDLDLNELYALKAARDREQFPLSQQYPEAGPKQVGKHLIRIFGRPDLSDVRLIMIGVHNQKTPDKRIYDICVWANELRLADFNRTPGWAVNTTMSAKLADFAVINGALRYTTFGFGSVSSKIGERTREETTEYDVSANVALDKLIPGNTGIKLPMFVSYGNVIMNPNYDPANPDMKTEAALASFNTDEERANFKRLIQDKTVRRGINFMNVRKTKVKPDAPIRLYDIENLALSYSYSDETRTNFFTRQSLRQLHRGSAAYTFTPKETGIEPFKDWKGLKSPYLKLIKDFNISLLPQSIAVRADLERSFNKLVYRNSGTTEAADELNANFLKYFTFNRTYSLRWNLSKGLSFEYNSTARAIIDEPNGELDEKHERDSVISNLKRFGRMKNFDQNVTINYTLPLDKLPVTDWLGADYRWQVGYNWQAGPLNVLSDEEALKQPLVQDLPDFLDFKNTIQNNRENNITGKVDLIKLYNKIGFLKKINTPPRPQPIRNTKNPQITRPDPKADTVKQMPGLAKFFFRTLMSVRSINGTYTLNEGTILPGFTPSHYLLGMDKSFAAPGWGFVLGSQDPDIRHKAAQNGWLTKNSSLTIPFSQIRTENITLRANIEPSADFKIQVDFRKEGTTSYQEIFRYDSIVGQFGSLNPSRSGNYKISFMSIETAFKGDNDEIESSVFREFESNLDVMKRRFREVNGGAEYDSTSQDVVIPAFIAAYSGKSPEKVSLSPFPRIPLPNWRIDYTGLNKLEIFKDLFQSITISHAYSSSYSVMNYSNSLEYDKLYTIPNGNFIEKPRYSSVDSVGMDIPIEDYNRTYFSRQIGDKWVPIYVISQVMISEQFMPLIGINIRTKGKMTLRLEYKTKRDVALNISNAQITEMNDKNVTFEIGYTKAGMKLPFKSQGRRIVLKNDFTFRMNVGVTDSKTIQRKVDEVNTITNGNINIQLRPNINYTVSQKLSLQLYFERTINDPVVSNSYRRATSKFGIQVRFSLAQ